MSANDKNLPADDGSLAATSISGYRGISDLSGVTSRYSKAKRRGMDMSDYAEIVRNDKKLSRDLRYCGSFLTFRHFYQVDVLRLHSAKFCHKHLLCPLCAIRRGAKALQRFAPLVLRLIAQFPSLKPYLVTLTIKDGPDLYERFYHLTSSHKRLLQARRDSFRPGRPQLEVSKAVGGAYSIETKRGQNSGEWHVHAHGIWLCSSKPDASRLAGEWWAFTGDSFVVDVDYHEDKPLETNLLEVFKYALKFSELPLDDNWDAYQALSGRNLFSAFGALRGFKLPDELNDDMSDLVDEPYVDLVFQFLRGYYQHVATERPEDDPDFGIFPPRDDLANLEPDMTRFRDLSAPAHVDWERLRKAFTTPS